MAFRLFDFLKRVPPAWVSLGAEDRRRSRRAARIAVTMALVGVFIGFAGLGSYYVISNNSANKERNVYTGDREIAHQLLHARSGLEDFLATGRADLLGGYQAAMKKLNAGLAAMKDESRDGGALALKTSAAVDSLSAEIQDWEARYIRVAIKLRQSNSDRALNILRGMQQRGVAATHSRVIERRLGTLQGDSDEWIADMRARSYARLWAALWAVFAGSLVFLGGGGYFLRWHVVQRRILLRRSARLEDLADYADRMHHLGNVDEAARALASSIGGSRNRSTVLLRIPGETGMRIAAYTGEVAPNAGTSPVLGDRAACPVMRTGQRLVIRDPLVEAPCECPACASRNGGYACVPLLAQGETAGLINWQAGPDRSPKDNDMRRIEEFARVTSLALTNLFSLEVAKHDAVTDQLTGVANRRFLDGYLAKQLQIAMRQERPLGILMLDLDLFKAFNDRNGHLAGDSLLRAAAKAATVAVRVEDLVARYGGEEFAVVLPDADMPTTIEVAERIRKGIAEMRVDDIPSLLPPVMTVSIGAAIAPVNGRTTQAVLRAADLALYSAKEKGRNRVEAATVPSSERAQRDG